MAFPPVRMMFALQSNAWQFRQAIQLFPAPGLWVLNILLALALAAIAQAGPAPASSFEPPTVRAGTAAYNLRYHGTPVRVCGIPSTPAGVGPNTFALSEFWNDGLLVQIVTKPPTPADPCVTGVVLRSDGLSNEAAQRLGRRIGPMPHTTNTILTLFECNDRESCDALIASVARRSAAILDQ